ncbi:hypothetical protein ACFL53_03225 [Pseudomonadota bacterium]
MAAKGDGLAEYALASYDLGWKGYIPFVRKKERLRRLKKALEMGYNYSAITINGMLLREHGYDTAPQHLREESVKYLLIAAKNGYAPAMTDLAGYSDIIGHEATKKWLYMAFELGYPAAAFSLANILDEGSNGFEKNSEQAYYHALISTRIGDLYGSSLSSSLEDGRIGGDLTEEKK